MTRPVPIIKISLWLIILVISQSCITSKQVQFEALSPSQNDPGRDIKTIELINAAIRPPSDSLGTFYGFNRKIYYDTTYLDTLFSMVTLDGFASKSEEVKRFNLVSSPQFYFHKRLSSMGKPLPVEVIRGLVSSSKPDGVIVLEETESFDHLDYGELYSNYVVARHTLYIGTKWRFYDLVNDSIHPQTIIIDTLYFDGEGNSVDNAINQIPDRVNSLSDGFFNNGKEFAEQIVPTWKKIKRTILSNNDNRMVKASYLALADRWSEAIDIWMPLTESTKKSLAALACYNMAVASERIGKPKIGLTWLQKSIALKSMSENQRYLIQLNEQVAQTERLMYQLGIMPD